LFVCAGLFAQHESVTLWQQERSTLDLLADSQATRDQWLRRIRELTGTVQGR
jgi:hypothetical protein